MSYTKQQALDGISFLLDAIDSDDDFSYADDATKANVKAAAELWRDLKAAHDTAKEQADRQWNKERADSA